MSEQTVDNLLSLLREAREELRKYEFCSGLSRNICPSCNYPIATVEQVGHKADCKYSALLAKIDKALT